MGSGQNGWHLQAFEWQAPLQLLLHKVMYTARLSRDQQLRLKRLMGCTQIVISQLLQPSIPPQKLVHVALQMPKQSQQCIKVLFWPLVHLASWCWVCESCGKGCGSCTTFMDVVAAQVTATKLGVVVCRYGQPDTKSGFSLIDAKR